MSVVRGTPPPGRKTVAFALDAKPIKPMRTAPRRAVQPAAGTVEARERFARAFTDVLSARFGGRWSVEWDDADRASLPPDRDGSHLASGK